MNAPGHTPVRFVPLGGFLGAGKTTTLVRAALALQARGERVAVVTNDQGEDLVDTAVSRRALGAAAGEVTGGCFCCRFDELADVVDRLVATSAPTVVLAEAVGSCTDLQATVVRPLRALRGDQVLVAPLVVLVDPDRYASLREGFGIGGDDTTDLAHLYHHQLAEADIIALNKVDTLTREGRDALVDDLQRRFPGRPVIPCSAARGDGFDWLVDVWSSGRVVSGPEPFAVDYARYGAAEAALAWTNQVLEVTGDAFVPDEYLTALLESLSSRLLECDAVVGHVKARMATARGVARGSVVRDGAACRLDESDPHLTDAATVLLNARVATSPQLLQDVIDRAVDDADRACATRAARRRGEVFRPGVPVPRHRM